MTVVEEVKEHIELNVFHSQLWDALDSGNQVKVVNQASNQLLNYYGQYDADENPLPVPAIVEQVLWVLMIDDSMKRADMGVTSINVSGMTLNVSQRDRSISPEVLRMLGRRVGRYGLPIADTFRHRTNSNYAKRGY
ncbi:hypothetical protein [Alkalicoccobacillus gibsonii]|uniref:hypothetical protein n=1 Tax=Alkalicoccobacillus gibsonii TaxID=79881 RepID=UPI0035112AE5